MDGARQQSKCYVWVEMRDEQERGGAAGGVAGSSGAG